MKYLSTILTGIISLITPNHIYEKVDLSFFATQTTLNELNLNDNQTLYNEIIYFNDLTIIGSSSEGNNIDFMSLENFVFETPIFLATGPWNKGDF